MPTKQKSRKPSPAPKRESHHRATGTRRLTTAQAIVTFLQNQFVERDGMEQAFFAGMLGIFGHGNVAGIGQALQQTKFPYILVRNEQSAVHLASGFAKMSNRLRA
ncbi:MAG TPA: thiamine pyrophosphate-binding protein, partial [Candidatus Acidoferrum sp.]